MNSVDFVCYHCGYILGEELIEHTQAVGLHCSEVCFNEAKNSKNPQAQKCSETDACMLEFARDSLRRCLPTEQFAQFVNQLPREKNAEPAHVCVSVINYQEVEGQAGSEAALRFWEATDHAQEMYATACSVQRLVSGKIALLTIDSIAHNYDEQFMIMFHDGKANAPVNAAPPGEAGSADDN